jgi:hypothetical protein
MLSKLWSQHLLHVDDRVKVKIISVCSKLFVKFLSTLLYLFFTKIDLIISSRLQKILGICNGVPVAHFAAPEG